MAYADPTTSIRTKTSTLIRLSMKLNARSTNAMVNILLLAIADALEEESSDVIKIDVSDMSSDNCD